MNKNSKLIDLIGDARSIMEDFDPSGAATIGFDASSYQLTADQMLTIASALYLAECRIHELEDILKPRQPYTT